MEVMTRVLLFCSRRSPWQRHGCLVTASATSVSRQQLAQFLSPKDNQTELSKSFVGSVRFYTQEKTSPHADIQSETSVQRRRGSPFQDNLRNCASPLDVLDVTLKYSPTVRQVTSCLTQMWSTTKKMSDDQRRYELQLLYENPGFEQLLKSAMKAVGYMRLEDMTYALLSMVKLGVPQESRVVQTYLRACQEKINDLDEKGLSILATCLRHMDNSPNVVALKDGMRLVVENRLQGIKNVMALQTMMRMFGKGAPKELKWKLESKALSMADQFSVPNAHYMVSTMAAMGFYSKPLLDTCSVKLTENLHGIPFNRLLDLLQSCRGLRYRDIKLLTAMSDYIASTLDVWTNKQLLLFLSAFEDLLFCPDALMQAYAEKVIANPDALTLKDLLCVLKVYSSSNHDLQQQRLQFLDGVSRVLTSYLPKITAFALLKCVYCLCVLGHFPSEPLEQLLQSSSLQKLEESNIAKNREGMFQTVDLCLRLDRPTLPRPLTVPSSVLGEAEVSRSSASPGFTQSLQKVLEARDDAVLEELVVVEKSYLIDAVVTKPPPRQTSGPEAASCAGGERAAVIIAANYSFCYGTSQPRGSLAVKLRHLKILGYEPILMLEHELLSMSEEQRVDSLRRRIFPQHQSSETHEEP